MLKRNSTPHAGIGIERYYWGCVLTGSRVAIIEGGYAVAPLPGDSGANKWTMMALDPQGREISIARKAKDRFTVSRKWSDEEAAAYAAAEEKRRLQREEHEQAERLVASWPKSAEQYREESRFMFQWGAGMIDATFSGEKAGGYRYDQDVIDRAKLLIDQLGILHETGRIVMDATLREQVTPACVAKRVKAADAAHGDRKFQHWLVEQGMGRDG